VLRILGAYRKLFTEQVNTTCLTGAYLIFYRVTYASTARSNAETLLNEIYSANVLVVASSRDSLIETVIRIFSASVTCKINADD
jgi:hypothetical protein